MLYTIFGQNDYGFFNPSKTSNTSFVTLHTELLSAPEILLRVVASTHGAKGRLKPATLNLLFGNFSVCLLSVHATFFILLFFLFYMVKCRGPTQIS